MKEKDLVGYFKTISVLLIVGILIAVCSLYTTRIAQAKPHEQVYYVVGYSKEYYCSFWITPVTKVLVSYGAIEFAGTNLVINVKALYYGGHYDFEIGQLYKIRSEGDFWWMYRKITMIEALQYAEINPPIPRP